MKIIHYIDADYNDGAFGGVSRFDHELKKALPGIITITKQRTGGATNFIFPDDTIFIVGNDDCLDIDPKYKCIVVHHGCALTHKDREPDWRGDKYVDGQNKMKFRGNNFYVSPSTFCSKQMNSWHGIESNYKVLHSVDLHPCYDIMRSKRVLGDWRNFNKGSDIIPFLRETAPAWEFIQLKCDPADEEQRVKVYQACSIYLTLSLSEGCSYSQLDALALGLPVLSTDVSLFDGDVDSRCGLSFSWKERDNVKYIVELLEEIHWNHNRYDPRAWMTSLNNFASWKNRWRGIIQEVADE